MIVFTQCPKMTKKFFRGITIIKFFCWNWVTQFWEPWGKHFSWRPKDFARCTKFLVVFFQNKPSRLFFRSKHCFFVKFSEKIRPLDWKVFVQPPGPILRSFFSSKSSFGHIECSSHKMAKKMRKTPKLFASLSKSDETFALNKSSFSAKCSLGQLECSVNNSGSIFSQSKWDVLCSRPESEKKLVYFVECIFSFKKICRNWRRQFSQPCQNVRPKKLEFFA